MMTSCIVAIAKKENNYIEEWVSHHLGIGVDRIIICDNNDTGDEKISDVIDDPRVTVLDYRDVVSVQKKAYTDCFLKYRECFEWMIFIDCDEFIMLDGKYENINQFLTDDMFAKADIIRLCWKVYSGGKKLDADGDYTVLGRFTDRFYVDAPDGHYSYSKSIIRGSIEYKGGFIQGHGYFNNKNNVSMNSEGRKTGNLFTKCLPGSYENAWIDHYPTKTIGEYVRQKYFRGGPNRNGRKYADLKNFFKYNDYDRELEEYGEKLITELKG